MRENQTDNDWEPDDKWDDPDPSPPLSERVIESAKQATKDFLNLTAGYLVMAFGWVAFLFVGFFVSFWLVGINHDPAVSGDIMEMIEIGARIVLPMLHRYEAIGIAIGGVSLVTYIGGAGLLQAYIKMKELTERSWTRIKKYRD